MDKTSREELIKIIMGQRIYVPGNERKDFIEFMINEMRGD